MLDGLLAFRHRARLGLRERRRRRIRRRERQTSRDGNQRRQCHETEEMRVTRGGGLHHADAIAMQVRLSTGKIDDGKIDDLGPPPPPVAPAIPIAMALERYLFLVE